MLFNSWEFIVFLVVTLLGYYSLRYKAQNVLLLLGSYVFYSWWDWRFSSLLIFSTVLDFYCAQGIHQSKVTRRRKSLLLVSLAGNLGVLGIFKYYNFFVGSFAQIIESIGLSANLPTLQIILPVGISFYTFQTMAYSIDVYRKEISPTKDFLAFALYVSFFPQLVAGPIERPGQLISQLTRKRVVTEIEFSKGLTLILIGFVKKIGIADSLAPTVNEIFQTLAGSEWQSLSAATMLMGIFFFTLQIYGDFSGYSDIARGTARLLGIRLMRNFEQPYFSRNISDFWRRWHISLSSWLRDYLYIPLGGSRSSELRTSTNLMVTMLLAGLWHGASWTFVVWGGLHGAYLVCHRFFKAAVARANFSVGAAFWGPLFTFVLVSLTWVFFRAPDLEASLRAFQVIANGGMGSFGGWEILKIGVYSLLFLSLDIPQSRSKTHSFLLDYKPVPRGIWVGILVAIILFTSGGDSEIPFIYFQF